jgi:hypothetical protein
MNVKHSCILALLFLTPIPSLYAADPLLAPNLAAVGLWIGEATLREVTHTAGGTNAPTSDQAQLRVIVHVASDGRVRLLKDITIAQKTGNPPSVILVTDSSLLPTVTGVVRKGGKLVGRRIASAAFDFTGNELLLNGGIGQNFRCEGTVTLDPNHPTNPFRHQYHPNFSSGFQISRNIRLSFAQAASNLNGVDQLAGTYEEVIAGLHKSTLTTKGTIVLNRISGTGVLNQ